MDIKPFDSRVWLSSPTMHGEEMIYMREAYNTNWMSTVGTNIDEAENGICEKIGCKYAVALSAGTAALHLAVKLAEVRDGDYVFCSDLTFDATVNPVVYEGGIPVFIDSERDTWNMDPEALKKAFEIYPDVKVVVLAHLYGTPGKVDEIREICDSHDAVIIEDAAESLGATYKGRQTGTFGKYNCISFNGNTNPENWILSNNGKCGDRLTLKKSEAYALSPKFHIPMDLGVTVVLNAYAYGGYWPYNYKPTVSIHPSEVGINSTVVTTLKGSIEVPGTASFNDISTTFTLTDNVGKVCIYTKGNISGSFGTGDIGVVCDHFSVQYK